MDYWLGDAIVMPPETDAHFSEQVWRLPRVWVSYDGKADAPRPAPRVAADGVVRLGSVANLSKLTPETLSLWARLLQALPEGRLLLKTKGLADPGVRQRILGILAANGTAPERVELQDWETTQDWTAHMGTYHRLDVALDPVDVHTGATTTCDALWMGVPVITKLGDRMGFRMTATALNALGHPEWIAKSDAEYVDKVVALARDAARRAELRLQLRDEMARSPLCDARDLARSLEDAYVAMYERWLAAQAGRTS
jgi:predicted O-linked N-acetylglucosamine transferase (SPINDLY family)